MSTSFESNLSVVKKSRATYSDLNRNFGSDGSDILFDSVAISQALHNLFSTTVGEAGPLFNPEFGSLLPQLLQEPMDDITAFKLRAATIQAVQRWEPRIQVDTANTAVFADVQNLAYLVILAYTIRKTGEKASSTLTISLLPEEVVRTPYSTLDYTVSYHKISWPGLYEYARLDGSTLRYGGFSYWDSAGMWSDLLVWGSDTIGGLPFIRFTAVVDRITTNSRRISFDFHGGTVGHGQTVTVEVATSHDDLTYSTYTYLTGDPITARFYKFRVTAISTSPELSLGNLQFFV